MNRHLAPDVETVFLMTSEESFYVSSSLVKEVAAMGGDITKVAPPSVVAALAEEVQEQGPESEHETGKTVERGRTLDDPEGVRQGGGAEGQGCRRGQLRRRASPTSTPPPTSRKRPRRRWTPGATKYTNVSGTPQLRKAVANWFSKAHGFDVAPNEVMVSAGAKQVIFNAFHAVLDEGDEVILPGPLLGQLLGDRQAGGRQARCRWCPGPRTSSSSTPTLVAKAITPRTRMLLVVSPCNPTGAVYDEKTLRALADLAVKHDLWLLTDDIYRSLIYGDAKFVQPATLRAGGEASGPSSPTACPRPSP